jgi:hypothetical protein
MYLKKNFLFPTKIKTARDAAQADRAHGGPPFAAVE